jgi:hypothetical protein
LTFLVPQRLSGFKRFSVAGVVSSFVLLVVMGLWAKAPAAGYTRLDLTEADTGRKIFSALLRDGEEAAMSWRNSLFGLDVIEVYQARQGTLVLDQVTFADPRGLPPPRVAPLDVDDLYHTGGPFTARGLDKSFSRVTYRVSEIGNPIMKIRDRTIALKAEVGFGGAVVLTAATPTWLEVFRGRLAPWS